MSTVGVITDVPHMKMVREGIYVSVASKDSLVVATILKGVDM